MSDVRRVDLSLVVPVYNSEKTIGSVVEQLISRFHGKTSFEIILVNDGSKDGSHSVCKGLAEKYPFVKFLSFYRNFGQISALFAGFKEAEGEVIVIMDDDLQNPPDEVPRLLAAIDKGYDFAFGVPEKMSQPQLRVIASRLTFLVAETLFDKPKGLYPSSFLAVRRGVIKEVLKYDGPFPYFAGLLFRVTHHGTNVIVRQDARKVGKSNYSLAKLLRLWLAGVTNFSILPLRIASITGVVFSLAGFAFVSVIIVRKLFFSDYQAGWVSALAATLLSSGIELMALGVLGEYIGRIFMVLNRTPQYSVREKYNCR